MNETTAMLDTLALLLARQAAISPRTLDVDFVEMVDDYISKQIRGGFFALDDLVANAVEIGTQGLDEMPEDCSAYTGYAEQQLAQALCQQAADQATWPEQTDCDRLRAGFSALETGGIACRMDYTCCMTCGSTELGREVEALQGQGRAIKGYAFFHQQDTEAAVEGHGIHLAYGSTQEDVDGVAIGQQVAQTLRAHGLQVEWSGDIRQRIGVKLDWQQRLDPEVLAIVEQHMRQGARLPPRRP